MKWDLEIERIKQKVTYLEYTIIMALLSDFKNAIYTPISLTFRYITSHIFVSTISIWNSSC